MTWKNRIVGHGVMPAGQFLAHPMNARVHPKNQQQATEDSLGSVGWIRDVLVSKRTGLILDGHLRVTLALRSGEETPVPFSEVDVDKHEEALILATLDPISAMATYDAAALDELLREVDTGSDSLQSLLSDLATDAGLYGLGKDDGEADPLDGVDMSDRYRSQFGVVVVCETEDEQERVYADLQGQGYACRVVVT